MNTIQRTSLFAGLALLLIQTVSYAAVTSPRSFGKQYVPDQILVKFKPNVAAAARERMAQIYGAQSMKSLGKKNDVVLTRLLPGQSVAQAVGAYSNDPNVEYAQPDYIYHALAVPNDPQYTLGQIWAAKNTGQTVTGGSYTPNTGTTGSDMNLEPAWSLKTDCSSVLVAVVDSGVNYTSEDLAANMWAGNAKHGQNFAADGAAGETMDLNGHGTHVAGIIGAVGNNAIAGTGVCWQASIMAVRVLDATGSGTTSSIISGINYAVANSARIINMSLGGTTFDQAYSNEITSAQAAGVLVVVAAGNDGVNNDTTPHYPCNFTQSNLICVAALDQNYDLATFSNYGVTSVDVGAPGTNIYSIWAGTSTVAYTDITSGFTGAGWYGSSTTLVAGGGWAANSGGYLIDPNGTWNSTLYNANTDDRAYKTFNLAGVNAAYLEVKASINVENGDYFNLNYMNTAGDPFAGGGTTAASVTNWHDEDGTYQLYPSGKINITPCISAACTLGFQLKSDADLFVDIGVIMTTLTITTMTNNSTSYNTINGTSMATPEVAGVAALVWAYNPSYTYADVANAVKNGGRSVTALNGKTTTGKAVDAMGALSYINKPTGIVVTVH